MRDFLGRELQLDDYVIFQTNNYRGFKLGKIINFTPERVRVKYGESVWNQILQKPTNLVKVEGGDVTMYYLKISS
jgi:hypothetical protein